MSIDMDLGIHGRTAIITGAGRGIGQVTANVLALAGAKVVAVDVDEAELNTTLENLTNRDEHLGLVKDLSEVQTCEEIIKFTEHKYNRLDILVNCASILIRTPLNEVDVSSWKAMHDVNLKSVFFLSRAAAEVMKKGEYGRIINFTSQGAYTGGFDDSMVYCAFKGGVITMTKSFARHYAKDGICVNAIAPGAVNTRMMANLTSEQMKKFLTMVPLGRMAEPEEIALGVLFLASRWASYVTGAVLDVNGGQYMR